MDSSSNGQQGDAVEESSQAHAHKQPMQNLQPVSERRKKRKSGSTENIRLLMEVLTARIPISLKHHIEQCRTILLSPEAQQEYKLTEKNIVIICGLLSGASYQELADMVGVSMNTVRFHIKVIYRAFAVSSRQALEVRLHELVSTAYGKQREE